MHVIQKRILSHTVLLAFVVLKLHCSSAVWEELKCVCVCGGTTDHIEERLFINNWLFNSNIGPFNITMCCFHIRAGKLWGGGVVFVSV